MNSLVKPEDILQELETAFMDIPFENSAFQNKAFVMAQQHTPGRAFRSIGLRMFSKIQALKEAAYARQLDDIDIEELRFKINAEETSPFDKRRFEIQINQKLDSRKWTDKLAGDALAELNTLYAEFKKFPAYTRESFEAEELQHFQTRLQRQIQIGDGAAGSLQAIRDLTVFDDMLENTRALACSPAQDKLEESVEQDEAGG